MIYEGYYKDIWACIIRLILRQKDRMSLIASVCFVKHVFGVQPSLDQHGKMQSSLIVVLFVQIVIFLLFHLQMMMRTNCMLDQMVVWR